MTGVGDSTDLNWIEYAIEDGRASSFRKDEKVYERNGAAIFKSTRKVNRSFPLDSLLQKLIENKLTTVPDSQTILEVLKVKTGRRESQSKSRYHPSGICFVEVKIDPENAIVNAGDYELSAVITNHGPQDTFAISASSDIGIFVSPSEELIELGPDESAPITLSLIIPQISSGVLDIGVVVSATAESNANLHNQASATLWLERFEAVFGDNFE